MSTFPLELLVVAQVVMQYHQDRELSLLNLGDLTDIICSLRHLATSLLLC